MRKKQITALVLAAALGASLMAAGCGSSAANKQDTTQESTAAEDTGSSAEEETATTGGWTNNVEQDDDVAGIFNTAIADSEYDGSYTYICSLATQVVAGTNYCFLADHGDSYALVFVYSPIDGSAPSVSKVVDDFAKLTASEDNSSGGWAYAFEDHMDVLSAAADQYDGIGGLNYIKTLGEQVVAGMNYKILCYSEYEGEDDEQVTVLHIATVYQDLEDNVELTKVEDLNVADYAE